MLLAPAQLMCTRAGKARPEANRQNIYRAMKKPAKIILIFFLLLACARVCFPQEQSQLLPPNPQFKHERKITQTYNPSADQTTIILQEIRIHSLRPPGIDPVSAINMHAISTFSGKTARTPQAVKLRFLILTTDPRSKYQVSVKADQEVVLNDSYAMTSQQDVSAGKTAYPPLLIMFDAPIPYAKFQQMVNARKVRVKVGGMGKDLSTEDMESLRDFASRMLP
jgi:hypothetical protein